MLQTTLPPSQAPARFGAAPRQRAGALVLAVVLHLLIFALFLLQRSIPAVVKMGPQLKAFMLTPQAKDDGEQAKAKTKTAKHKSDEAKAQPTPPPPPPPPKRPPPTVPSDNKLPFILVTGDDFAASDISRMTSLKAAAASPGQDSQADYGPGEGPGGATLYNADWYREPSNAQLSGYLPAGAPRAGWGLIACKTIEHYHVDDCITLGESPLGSGFGRAVREAAWQFLVLPPRINGRPMIGSWVRIRITYTNGGAAGPG